MSKDGGMLITIPAETKVAETRVALTPDGARDLIADGHEVWVQQGAGAGSALTDAEYLAAGVRLVDVDLNLQRLHVDDCADAGACETATSRHRRDRLAWLHILRNGNAAEGCANDRVVEVRLGKRDLLLGDCHLLMGRENTRVEGVDLRLGSLELRLSNEPLFNKPR